MKNQSVRYRARQKPANSAYYCQVLATTHGAELTGFFCKIFPGHHINICVSVGDSASKQR